MINMHGFRLFIYSSLFLINLYSTSITGLPNLINKDEQQYLDLVADILKSGNEKQDRTGVGTISKFGAFMKFDLSNGVIPLLTTKRVFFKGIVEELLWIISGSTDATKLSEKGIKIWNGNGTREFLDKLGFTERAEFDLGPIYGFQWRHFGAEYKGCNIDYTGQGIDQLLDCINLIKSNPHSRRIVLSSWNPLDLNQMVLPPCHVMCQFYVFDGKLSCCMYQRSADLGLGVPFNIASYSLLTHLVAQCTNLSPDKFVYFIGDAHVYKNHIDGLKEQISRKPRAFPRIKIDKNIKDIDQFTSKHIKLKGYNPYKAIKLEMAV